MSSDMATTSSPTKRTKLLLTGSLCISYMAFGIGYSMLGSTLIDIQQQINTSMKDVSFAFATRSVMTCIFALIFGWAFNYIKRQFTLAFGLGLCALSLGVTPLVKSVIGFHVAQGAFGISVAAIQVAINAFMLELWKENSNMYMQTMHAFYTIGSIFGPLISEPYLAPDDKKLSNFTSTTVAPDEDVVKSQIYVPFSISAAILLLMAAMQVVLFFVLPYTAEKRTVQGQKSKPKADLGADNGKPIDDAAPGSDDEQVIKLPTSYYVTAIVSGAIILCFEGGVELNAASYLQTFAVNVNPTKIDKSKAAFMGSGLYGAFTVSRIISIFLAMKVRTVVMLYVDIVLILLGNLIIFFTATNSFTGLWIGIVIMGLGFSSCWPGVYAFLEERISVTNVISGLLMCATSTHAVAAPFIQGVYIDDFPMIFAYINLVSAVLVVIFFLVLHSTDYTREKYVRRVSMRLT